MSVKLCRFDLASSPGSARSGIVYGGKVFETDGSNPVAVHEWSDARLLAPVGQPTSVRLFSAQRPAFAEWLESDQEPGLSFTYLNPSLVLGPQSLVPRFGLSTTIGCKPCLAAVIGEPAADVEPSTADGLIIGLSLAAVFYAIDLERDEMAKGLGIGRSHDVGVAVGPALSTPDEMDDFLAESDRGRAYRAPLSMRLNGEEVLRVELGTLPWTLGEIVSFASRSCSLAKGDLFLLAVGTSRTDQPMSQGDEVHVLCEPVGLLANRLG